MTTRTADHIRILFCQSCDCFHVLLYADAEAEPFGMCDLEPNMMADLIDADDTSVLFEHQPRIVQ
jgi:hypothetical protein